MFKIIVKLADGSVERWDHVTAKMVNSIRNMYNGTDVFKFSVMEQTAE